MQIRITLDQKHYERLKEDAEKNRRSLSAEINMLLDEKYNNTTNTNTLTKQEEEELIKRYGIKY